jgi:hypothetical protein
MNEQIEQRGGGITDEALIGLVGAAFDEGRRGHEASDVLARGRQLRRRKRAVPALGALGVLAASASLALALAGPNSAASASPGHALTSNGTVVNVDEASFSVHTNAKTGIVTVTLRQFFDEDELKPILAKAGVRAVFNPRCTGPGVKSLALLPGGAIGGRETQGGAVITIDPSKMPSGSVLEFIYSPGPYAPYKAMGFGLLSGEPTGACAPS